MASGAEAIILPIAASRRYGSNRGTAAAVSLVMRVLAAVAVACAVVAGCGSGAAAARPAPVRSPAAAGSAGTVPASLEVPAGFQPAAASFVSPAWGVVLGGSGCTLDRPCRAQLAVTADGGAHWSVMRAPAVWLADGRSSPAQVGQVLFADRSSGWLYQPYTSDMWATHDGGASWREITLPGSIRTMAASAHAVYAVAGSQLYSSPPGRDAWVRVSARTRSGPMTGSILAVSGTSAWFGGGMSLWMTADGEHWARYPLHSPGTAYGLPYELAGIAAASSRNVAFLWGSAQGMYHTVMKVQISSSGGRTQAQTLKAPPPEGDPVAFAVAPGRSGVILAAVEAPPADYIYRSASLGKTWITVTVPGTSGGITLNSLEFMSPAAGCLVTGNPGYGFPGALLRTANAGQTWYQVRF